MAQEIKKIGFIGLGDIGLPMAKKLVGGGYEVNTCGHFRREPVEEMRSLGAREVKTPKEVALASQVTITMVRDDVDTAEVVLGANGVIEGTEAGSGIIMMSTLSPAFCKRVGQVAKERRIGVLDAPVTGTRMRAATGELGIMVGGERELVEKYRPVLETMGSIIYCGDLGMGEIVKLVNNMALVTSVTAYYEAIAWGIANGANEQLLVELMKMGTANSFVVQHWDYAKSTNVDPPPPIFYLGTKDLSYALKIAREIGQACPMAALACGIQTAGPMNKLLDDAKLKAKYPKVSQG